MKVVWSYSEDLLFDKLLFKYKDKMGYLRDTIVGSLEGQIGDLRSEVLRLIFNEEI